MKRKRWGLLSGVFLIFGLVNIATAGGLFIYNNHEYALTSPALTWLDAEAKAVAWGGHLVTINDQVEQDWLTNTFPYADYPGLWIGINDVTEEGVWVWLSEEPVTYTNWAPGEPNNRGGFGEEEDAAVMNWNSYGQWNDVPVSDSRMGIMERPISIEAVEVDIDIKPGSYPNSINLKSKGVLPVAILAINDFDAIDVDVTTVFLGDPELSGTAAPIRSSEEDVDGDDDVDLLLLFSIPELVDNGALDADSEEAILTGETFDGVPIVGSDSVRIVPPEKKK